jgi:hypothetical protein
LLFEHNHSLGFFFNKGKNENNNNDKMIVEGIYFTSKWKNPICKTTRVKLQRLKDVESKQLEPRACVPLLALCSVVDDDSTNSTNVVDVDKMAQK